MPTRPTAARTAPRRGRRGFLGPGIAPILRQIRGATGRSLFPAEIRHQPGAYVDGPAKAREQRRFPDEKTPVDRAAQVFPKLCRVAGHLIKDRRWSVLRRFHKDRRSPRQKIPRWLRPRGYCKEALPWLQPARESWSRVFRAPGSSIQVPLTDHRHREGRLPQGIL